MNIYYHHYQYYYYDPHYIHYSTVEYLSTIIYSQTDMGSPSGISCAINGLKFKPT
jgi:hypothetical protein